MAGDKEAFSTEIPMFRVRAQYIENVRTTEEEELLRSVPKTGFGTVAAPEDDIDHMFPACGMFLTGFFCIFPWMIGTLYIKSDNLVAKTAGILSGVLLAISVVVLGIWFLLWEHEF